MTLMKGSLIRLLIGCAILLAPAGAVQGSAADGQGIGRGAPAYPASMVVIGTGPAVGFGADPAHPFREARENTWAAGTNPAVQSIYSRLLTLNPALRGHRVNLAQTNATLAQFHAQVERTLALKPDLVLVNYDGEVRCDGNDQTRVAEFGTQVTAELGALAKALPNTRIFAVGPWGSESGAIKFLNSLSRDARLKHAGKSPCQFVDYPSGRVEPLHVAYVFKVFADYASQLARACATISHCRSDGGTAQRLAFTADDVALDQQDLSLQGQAKLAAAEWPRLARFLESP